jgi:hypothetical protein
MTPNFHYRQLPGSDHIRLLSFTNNGSTENASRLRLELTEHNLKDDAPTYIAISYVWGPIARDQEVTCNNTPMSVTTSAFEAITALRPYLHDKLFWIDSLCINQDDDAEKGHQISLMSSIFRSAKSVAIWLGGEANDSAIAMSEVDRLAELLPTVPYQKDATIQSKQYGMPKLDDPVWQIIGNLYQRPWFIRLWTFQEIVLALNADVYCGAASVTWEKIATVAKELHRLDLCMMAYGGKLTDRRGDGFTSVVLTCEAKNMMAEYGYVDSSRLVGYSRRKLCSLPKDRIFAMLSLSSPGIQRTFKTSYTESTREAYIDYGRACLQDDNLMLYLSIGSTRQSDFNLPSWCMNLDEELNAVPMRYSLAAGRVKSSDPRWGLISDNRFDADFLSLAGAEVDRIVDVIPNTFNWKGYLRDEWLAKIKNISDWERAGLDFSRLAANSEEEALEAHLCTITTTIGTKALEDLKYKQAYADARRYWDSVLLNTAETKSRLWIPPEDRVITYEKFRRQLHRVCPGRPYFRTEKGRVGIGSPKCCAGDTLAVIYGAGPVFVLRERQGSDGEEQAFQLVGDAFVHGLMNIYDVKDDDAGQTRMFKII